EYLQLYFPPNVLHFWELEFNFRTRAKIAKHKGKMETMQEGIDSVPSGRVMIFISAHSKEEQGDLFAGEECPQTKPRPIAVKVDQCFSLLFASRMDHLLKGAMVVLLTCAWLVRHERSFQDLHYSLHCLQVSNCVALTAPHLQSYLSSSFLQALLCKTFIEGATLPSSMPFALENSFCIGQHSNVLLFLLTKASSESPCRKFVCSKFFWWNKQTRPYGTCLPLCCPICGALHCWDRPVWSGLIGEGSWSVGCANPHCGLGKNGA
ncbi:hypothetical protein PAXRUDRAFT_161970, partial [Paxillus rubicundulus Ve08.2h10]